VFNTQHAIRRAIEATVESGRKCNLALFADTTFHLNASLKLWGQDNVITNMSAAVRGFRGKIQLLLHS
jgi:hypothetical protein